MHELKQNSYSFVLYIDGDIVIKRNFKDILIKKMENLDFLFQNDKNPKKPLQLNLCAGFMMIKSNKKTLRFFNPETLPINRIINYRTHDQTYIIKNRAKFKYQTLPLDKFPMNLTESIISYVGPAVTKIFFLFKIKSFLT